MCQQFCCFVFVELCKMVAHRLYQLIGIFSNLLQFLTNHVNIIQIVIHIKPLLCHLCSLVSNFRIRFLYFCDTCTHISILLIDLTAAKIRTIFKISK